MSIALREGPIRYSPLHVPLLIAPLVFLLLIGCRDTTNSDGSASLTLRDAVGDTVHIAPPADRIVSLAPNLTEGLFAVEAGDALVGRTSWCTWPAAALTRPVVGDLQSVDYERLLALSPDVVLMSIVGNSNAVYDRLKELGLRPLAIETATIEGVAGMLDTLGMITGQRDAATKAARRLTERIDSIRRSAASRPVRRVFLVLNVTPLVTTAGGFLSECVAVAGGRNIAEGGPVAYPTWSREELLRNQPDLIVIPSADTTIVDQLLGAYPEWRELDAVRSGNVVRLDPDILLRPGPRIAEGIARLSDAIARASVDSTNDRTD